ncbi:Hint domain-containing protein [Paracoccus laeviglucosivorans]|uniref:Lamin Tail Domain n=1 Tax=Paracoccus laeviglucosivorans TaxID=1197861 RepID=A0A521BWW6_9RHOB|nr:Hint domain-containing protein [Paracoccus laeviglucosivorans]SMO51697.1 Lamin Tail Domain [Paracoccus laeviglucosivorans]
MADALRGGLVINEIYPQPIVAGGGGFDSDQSGTADPTDEFIEFFNSSDDPIDMSGLELWDPGTGNWFTFPQGAILPAGGYAVVITNVSPGGTLPDADLSYSAGRPGPLINNPGDNIILHDPAASEFIVAAFGNWPIADPHDPTTAPGGAPGLAAFPPDATQVGTGEHFGPLIPGQSIQRIPNGGDSFDNDTPPTPGSVNLCFVSGTMIETPDGPRLIETLAVGDAICTASGGRTVIRWIGLRRMLAAGLRENPQQWPIRFAAGALAPGLPDAPLRLSPQHRIIVSGPIARRMFDTNEVLVAAKDFLDLPGVDREMPEQDFWYIHLMTDHHDIVLAQGVAAETLYFGKVARDNLPVESIAEILAIFPDLAGQIDPQSARTLAKGRPARRLIERHLLNEKPLQRPLI